MPPTNNCPNCGRTSSPGVSFCASCGSNLSSTSGGRGWKLLLGAVALLGGLLWASVLYTQTRPSAQVIGPSQPQGLVGSGQGIAQAQAAQPAPSTSLTLTSAQQLAEAKRALADGYKPNKDPQKTTWGEVAAAKWHLKAIGTTAPEYREAQELLKEVARRERQIELARKKVESNERAGETAAAAAAAEEDSDEASETASSSTTPSSPSGSSATPL